MSMAMFYPAVIGALALGAISSATRLAAHFAAKRKLEAQMDAAKAWAEGSLFQGGELVKTTGVPFEFVVPIGSSFVARILGVGSRHRPRPTGVVNAVITSESIVSDVRQSVRSTEQS